MTDPDEQLLADLRPNSFAIAYRMLGSVAEAEDVVQEALLRVHEAINRGEDLASPQAYAATVTTRLAIDQLRSARARRETYPGEWLPEPLVTDSEDDPEAHAELSDSLSIAFLALLERLSPEQRAVLLLHDVFDYGYDEIAGIIGRSQDNARQLASRARRHVADERPRFETSEEQHRRLARRFFAAVQDGDVGALESMLAEDVVLRGDGGGKAPALARPLQGRSRVARTFAAWGRQSHRIEGFHIEEAVVNGGPGVVLRDGEGRVISVMALEIADGYVRAINSVINPDKLRHVGEVADAWALLKGSRRRAT